METLRKIFQKIINISVLFFIIVLFASAINFVAIIHPIKSNNKAIPNDYNLESENVNLIANDGARLSAWFIPSDKTDKALIILHGYGVSKADMISKINPLFYPDFSVLLVDLRYFGQSEGLYTTFGISERNDIVKAVDFLEERGYEKIGIFGFSLGGATAILTANEDSRVDAVASYASFSDMMTLGENRYNSIFGVVGESIVQLIYGWSQITFKESVTKISPYNAIRNLKIPVLIAHNKKDKIIPFSHAKQLEEAVSANLRAEFYFSETGSHTKIPDDFLIKLKSFFERNI